jgi:N-acetylneuraminate epimerase
MNHLMSSPTPAVGSRPQHTRIAMQIHASEPVHSFWPAYPQAAKFMTAVRIGEAVYAGLGSAGASWQRLDLRRPEAGWRPMADYPGGLRESASAVAVGDQVLVFGGQGRRSPADAFHRVDDSVWGYDPQTDAWTRLAIRAPMGLLASAVHVPDERSVLFFGGVNTTVFDGHNQACHEASERADTAALAQRQADFMGLRPQDYLFSREVIALDVPTGIWRQVGTFPGTPVIGAGLLALGRELCLVGGEIKPGLRHPPVTVATLHGDAQAGWRLAWSSQPLPPPPWAEVQDGLAGAHAGHSHGVPIVAGGANFPGSRQQFEQGRMWAHRELRKIWHPDIYARVDGRWQWAGKLVRGRGYGAQVQLDDSLLLIGGETQDGHACADLTELRWCPETRSVRVLG